MNNENSDPLSVNASCSLVSSINFGVLHRRRHTCTIRKDSFQYLLHSERSSKSLRFPSSATRQLHFLTPLPASTLPYPFHRITSRFHCSSCLGSTPSRTPSTITTPSPVLPGRPLVPTKPHSRQKRQRRPKEREIQIVGTDGSRGP
jgi:hypothetical protein